MENRKISNVKLGIFVLSGLLFLVLVLYMIGRNSNLFGHTYELKARFSNVQGLVPGNNVRYAGIETGTIKRIYILNDTVIEVTMVIQDRMKNIIRKNSLVSIGTEGLVGNKVINITPAPQPGLPAQENDILLTIDVADTDEMLQILDETTRDVAQIAEELKMTIRHINNSTSLWSLLDDPSISNKVKYTMTNIHQASSHANDLTKDLNSIITDVRNGKGSIGALLTDTSFSRDIASTLQNLKKVSLESDSLAGRIDSMLAEINDDIQHGSGPIHSILKDSLVFTKVHSSLESIQMGTEKFNQNMEALKHNFLFRGYFKKQEKQSRRLNKMAG